MQATRRYRHQKAGAGLGPAIHPRRGTPAALLCTWLAVALGLGAVPGTGVGQDTDSPQAAATEPRSAAATRLPDKDEIEARIKVAESATDLDDAARSALIERYRRILVSLEAIRGFEARIAELAQIMRDAPAQTAEIRAKLDAEASPDPANAPQIDKLSSEDITQQLGQIQTELSLKETQLDELEKNIENAPADMDKARARISTLKENLSAISAEQSDSGTGADLPPSLAEAFRWDLAARREAAAAELRVLEQELASVDVRTTLARAKRELGAREIDDISQMRRALEAEQAERQRQDAEQARQEAEAAQQDAADKDPLIQQAADGNAALTEALAKLTASLDGLDARTEKVNAERKQVDDDFRAARQRFEVAGLTRALGQIFIERRGRLPDLGWYEKQLEKGEDRIADTSLSQIRFREERNRLRDIDALIDELAADAGTPLDQDVREQLRELLDSRRKLLDKAQAAEDDVIRKQSEQNDAIEQLIRSTEAFDRFLSEHLLWVRTLPPASLKTFTALPDAALALLSPTRWGEVLKALSHELTHSPLTWLGLFVATALFALSARIRRAIVKAGEPLRRISTDSIRHSFRALALTLVAALPLPVLASVLGHALVSSIESTDFTRAVGQSLIFVASTLFFLRALRLLCISGGVADRHFRWRTPALTVIRREARWFTIALILLGLVAAVVFLLNDPAQTDSLGRLTMVALLLTVALFLARLFNPRRGAIAGILADNPEHWSNRTRNLWYPLVVAIPLALAGLSLLGYLYTAGTLVARLLQALWMVLGLVIAHQLIVRWLMMTRRRLALQAALERQAQRRAQAEAAREPAAEQAAQPQPPEEPEPDLAELDEKTRKLVNALFVFAFLIGDWIIWADTLPALNRLEQIALWHYTGVVDGTEQLVPVTAADAGLVLLIIVVATVAARNLPALIEIVLLEATSVSAGTRYAVRTLLSYTITAVAFMTAFGTLGLSWSQVQWLVAALGVGIGFGLQEIVANFISGIIILFERPVRVGDVITIGDTTGSVTNIQIRATTIRNWDKQELLVPNKELITGRLLNWTLTDQVNRVTVTLGIAYGSNVELALSLLARVAEEHPLVLDEPAPLISFEGFGDNALTVVLRCYLPNLDNRLGVITELHKRIDEVYAEHGVVIAFPQRDIHLTAREPIDIRVVGDRRNDGGTEAKTPA